MTYYTERIKREPNHRGKMRLVTALGHQEGVLGHGFDGDGTVKGATVRLWETSRSLPTPLPDGVKLVTQKVFDDLVAKREAIAEASRDVIQIEEQSRETERVHKQTLIEKLRDDTATLAELRELMRIERGL